MQKCRGGFLPTSRRRLGGVRPRQFMKVYEIRGDETPDYNRDDFIESFWLSPREILNRIEAGEAAKGDLSALVKRFYL